MRSKLEFLKQVQPDLIATQLLEETGRWFYRDIESAVVRNITHAINPNAFRPGPLLSARSIDIGARSDRYNLYVGDLQRVGLYELVQQKAGERSLVADVQLGGARFERQGWADFLAASKATIATEAGSAYLDRDDRLSDEVSRLLRQKQGSKMVIRHLSPVRKFTRMIVPRPIRHAIRRRMNGMIVEDIHLHHDVDPAVVRSIQQQVFRAERRAPHYTKCISSRHFDAAACKTVQILTAGRYNDMLQPGRHYIELDPDFGNIDEVLVTLKDARYCQNMVETAYDELMSCHCYSHRMNTLEHWLRAM